MPTLDDEFLLFDTDSVEAVIAHYQDYNFHELIIKDGANGCYVASIESGEKVQHVPIPASVIPIDTTAAGDSFNAGFIAARMQGDTSIAAALVGHKIAARVIAHSGAIISKTEY